MPDKQPGPPKKVHKHNRLDLVDDDWELIDLMTEAPATMPSPKIRVAKCDGGNCLGSECACGECIWIDCVCRKCDDVEAESSKEAAPSTVPAVSEASFLSLPLTNDGVVAEDIEDQVRNDMPGSWPLTPVASGEADMNFLFFKEEHNRFLADHGMPVFNFDDLENRLNSPTNIPNFRAEQAKEHHTLGGFVTLFQDVIGLDAKSDQEAEKAEETIDASTELGIALFVNDLMGDDFDLEG